MTCSEAEIRGVGVSQGWSVRQFKYGREEGGRRECAREPPNTRFGVARYERPEPAGQMGLTVEDKKARARRT